jgi:hypothetical protein
MHFKRVIVGLGALLCIYGGFGFTATHAQVSYGVRVCSPSYTTRCIKPNADGSINIVGGSGDGGPVTIVDGGDVTEGAKADAACATDSGTCTVKAMIGRTNGRLTTINTTLGTPLQAGGTVVTGPSSSSGVAITPVVSSAAETGHILKASAGNFYSLVVTTGATAGYVMIHNSATVPSAGAVTPLMCVAVPANTTVSIGASGDAPTRYSTGISASFSSTGCFTQTDSATAFFAGNVQ